MACSDDQLRTLERRNISLSISVQQLTIWRNLAIERADDADKKSAELLIHNEELQRHTANRFIEIFADAEIEGFRAILEEPRVEEVVKLTVILDQLLQVKKRQEAAATALEAARDDYRGATQGLEDSRAQYEKGCEAYDEKLNEAKQQAASYKDAADSMLEAEKLLLTEKERLVGLRTALIHEMATCQGASKKKQMLPGGDGQGKFIASGTSSETSADDLPNLAELFGEGEEEPPQKREPPEISDEQVLTRGLEKKPPHVAVGDEPQRRREPKSVGTKVLRSSRVEKVSVAMPSA